MAAIETLTNVSKISDKLYEVTIGEATIGAAIDDLENAIIIIKNGGKLKFGQDCATTFIRCLFLEEDDAGAFPSDNYTSATTGRFYGDVSCAPIFKGCQFQVNIDSRSDFDISILSSSPTFTRTDLGERTMIMINRESDVSQGVQYNHFASGLMSIDGLIVDHRRAGGAFEFGDIPSTTSDLTIVDNDPGSNSRHVVILTDEWDVGVTAQTINRLQCRNVALWGTGGKTVTLLDPVGRIEKTDDLPNSYQAKLVVCRTYQSTAHDPVNGVDVSSRFVITGVDGTTLDTYAISINQAVSQFEQDFLSLTIIDKSTHRIATAKYGFHSFVVALVVADTVEEHLHEDIALMRPDINLTEANAATVGAYTEIANSAELYDFMKLFEEVRTDDDTLVGESYVTALGEVLDFGSLDVTIDPTFVEVVEHLPTEIKVKASYIDATTFTSIKTTGNVVFSNGAATNMGVLDASGFSTATIAVPTGFTTASVHSTQSDADNNLNAISTGLVFNYSSVDIGGTTLWFRITGTAGEIITSKIIPVAQGEYIFEIILTSTDLYLQSIEAKVDQLVITNDNIDKYTKLIPAIL